LNFTGAPAGRSAGRVEHESRIATFPSIYRDALATNVTAEDIEAGRNLLRAAGKIN